MVAAAGGGAGAVAGILLYSVAVFAAGAPE